MKFWKKFIQARYSPVEIRYLLLDTIDSLGAREGHVRNLDFGSINFILNNEWLNKTRMFFPSQR